MKQLTYTIRELRAIFDLITVSYISEKIIKANVEELGEEIRNKLIEKHFDIMPIELNDNLIGYVTIYNLTIERISEQTENIHKITNLDLISESTPILELFNLFKNRKWYFVLKGNEVNSIVTAADFRKAPVRMYIFALINLIEMQLTKMIKNYHKEDNLKELLNEKRLADAQRIYTERLKKNEDLDIFDCLQICDKRDICLGNEKIFNEIKIESKNKTRNILKNMEDLRNNLAHGCDMIKGFTWNEFIELVENMKILLEKCENIDKNE